MDNKGRITATTVRHNLANLRQVTFEVTDDCNLRCRYCGYGEMYCGYDERKSGYLDFSQVKPLVDYLSGIWSTYLPDSSQPVTYFSFYGGEPLLNMPFIEEAVKYIEDLGLNRKVFYSMTTNAMLLDRYMDYLVENDFHLLISLDGDKEGHGYRVDKSGNNSFYRVIRNVKQLQNRYPDYFRSNVNFNAVLHNRNSVQSIYRFIKSQFDKTPSISELNNSGIRPDKVKEFQRTYRNKYESLHQAENYEKLSEDLFIGEPSTYDLLIFLHQYSGNVFMDYNDLFMDQSQICMTPTGTCTPFSKKMFVTVNGKILQCERIDHCYALGKVSEDGLDLDLGHISKTFNSYLDRMQSQCSACYNKKSCMQCMYYIDNLRDRKPVCHGFMGKKDFERYVSYCLGHLAAHPDLYRRLMTEVAVE